VVSVLKQWVLIIDIPRTIYDLQKRGYTHFEAEFKEDTRRLEFKAWKAQKREPKFACGGCTRLFLNPQSLKVHRQYTGHPK